MNHTRCQRSITHSPNCLGKHQFPSQPSHGVMTLDSMQERHGGTSEPQSSEKIHFVRNVKKLVTLPLQPWLITFNLAGLHQNLSLIGPTCNPYVKRVTIVSQDVRGGVVLILKSKHIQTVEVIAVCTRAKLRTILRR
jgi:hypothetical protein